MKNIVLNFAMLLFSVVSYSQTVAYEGRVVDEQQKPISYADILAINENDEVIQGGITDNYGRFKLEIVAGYIVKNIKINFIGFENQLITPKTNHIGTIILKEKATKLEEITIISRKKMIEQKVDRLVF